MADTNINLSLDEIIKKNRKGAAGGKKKPGQALGLAAKKRQAALLRRQKGQQKAAAMGQNRSPGSKVRGRGLARAPQRGGQRNALNSTFATRKLVQTLVKKALAQRRVAGRGRVGALNRTPIRQRIQMTRTPIRVTTGRGRGGSLRGRVALRVGGRGGLRIGGRPTPSTTGVKARLGFVAQKNNRFNTVNQRRGLDLQLNTQSTQRARGRGRGGFGRMASDQIAQEQNAIRRQQQSMRRQRVLTTRGRGGRFATGGFSVQQPRFQLVSPSRQQQQFGSPRGGRGRGRGRGAFFSNASTSGFGGGDEVRGVRASFSNSRTGTTLNDRFGGGRQQVRVGLKQQRGGFRGGRRQIYY